MNDQPHIRPCTLQDLTVLRNLAEATFTETFAQLNNPRDFQAYLKTAFSLEKVRSEISHPDTEFYLLMLDGQYAGYLKLNFGSAQSDLQDVQSLEIERIYVLSQYQGLGLGRHLFDLALRRAKARSLSYIWLGVWEKNEKAIGFYKRQGFYEFSSHVFQMGEDLQTDKLMRLDI